jgi:hypothetical protein
VDGKQAETGSPPPAVAATPSAAERRAGRVRELLARWRALFDRQARRTA